MTGLLAIAGAGALTLATVFAVLWWTGANPDLSRWTRWRGSLPRGTAAVGWLVGAVVGTVVAGASRIVVLGVLVAILVAGVPEFFVGARLWARRVNQTKAVAAWGRMLSEQTAAGVGLRKALVDTAARAPERIRERAIEFTGSLATGAHFDHAARQFAEQLQDEEVDVLVGALSMVSSGRAGDVAAALAELAKDCQQAAASRQRSDTNRTEDRTSARLIGLISVLSFLVMGWTNRDLIAALSGPLGQLVLAIGGGIFICGHRLMARMDRPPTGYRHVLPEARG